ncbi:MAG: hypothetical protein Q8Q82_13865 [Hydrogenophaga sp.]|nr:hypothetical protein [Hydrogenophaga sp.]
MDAHECLSELKQLAQRAEDLLECGNRRDPHSVEQAKADYRALKERLASRVRDFQRERRGSGPEWWASTFESGLRKAHIAMRSPTNVSPGNAGWQSSVLDLGHELRYYADRLEEGLQT